MYACVYILYFVNYDVKTTATDICNGIESYDRRRRQRPRNAKWIGEMETSDRDQSDMVLRAMPARYR